MRLGRAVRLSARGLLAHRVRAALAVTSVAIGVAAVLVTGALGQGARDAVLRDVATMGTNLLVVRPAQVEQRVARAAVRGRVTSLRLEDSEAIGALPAVGAAAPGADRRLRLKAGRRSMEALILGTSGSFFALRGLRLRSGRFLEAEEERTAARVAILGARVNEMLFPGRQPIGETLRIDGVPFEIVGVLASRGVLADGSDEDGNVFVPVRTAQRRLFNTTWLTSVFVSAKQAERMTEAAEEVRRLLRERHGITPSQADDFDVQDQTKLLTMRATLADSLTLLAAGLAGASLLVGGTGVLALMFLSVKERTTEIGLRLAVGARQRDIFRQFVIEASALALGGWLVGALMASVSLSVIAHATHWSVGLPVFGLAASLVATGVTGIGFGAWPARRAANVPPIGALRSI